MSRTAIDRLVTEKALCIINAGAAGVDALSSAIPETVVKNVCAKVSNELADEIANVAGLLDISQRRFLEAAMIDAVHRAHEIIEAEGVYEYLASEDRPTFRAVEGGE